MSWIRSVPASLVALSLFAWPVQGADSANSSAPLATWRLQARVVAVGLPGVAGVRQVGRFHSGGPIPSNPEFLLQTAAGRVLDAERVLVAVTGNFGAPLGSAAYATTVAPRLCATQSSPTAAKAKLCAAASSTSMSRSSWRSTTFSVRCDALRLDCHVCSPAPRFPDRRRICEPYVWSWRISSVCELASS
jgi:hypothetical protein